jgi:peptide deformylase
MAVLEIVTLPDPRLKIKSKSVEKFDATLKKLVSDLADTMKFAKGIGLAAVQVGVHQRVLVLDIGDLNDATDFIEGDEESERRLAANRTQSRLEIYVNPEIVSSEGTTEFEEGCLSVPGVYSKVCRKEKVKLRYQDVDGNYHELEADGLRAIALQHEMDHLEGIVFTDRLGPIQRMMVLKKYQKLQKSKAEAE